VVFTCSPGHRQPRYTAEALRAEFKLRLALGLGWPLVLSWPTKTNINTHTSAAQEKAEALKNESIELNAQAFNCAKRREAEAVSEGRGVLGGLFGWVKKWIRWDSGPVERDYNFEDMEIKQGAEYILVDRCPGGLSWGCTSEGVREVDLFAVDDGFNGVRLSATCPRNLIIDDLENMGILGKGGFGSVYAMQTPAYHADNRFGLLEMVAVKLMHASEGAWHECSVLDAVDGHDNIVSLRMAAQIDDGFMMAMDLLEGGDVWDFVDKYGPMEEFDAVTLMREVSGAVAHMHSHGVAHRDLKPENVAFSRKVDMTSPKLPPVKVVDFGLADVVPESDIYSRTCMQAYKGTVGYTAPELVLPSSFSVGYADVWALGALFYYLIEGHLPFGESGLLDIAELASNAKPEFSPSARSRVGIDTLTFIDWCLEGVPEDRPQAHQLHEMLLEKEYLLSAQGYR